MSAKQRTPKQVSGSGKPAKKALWPPPGLPWYVYDFWREPKGDLQLAIAARWHHMVAEATRKPSIPSSHSAQQGAFPEKDFLDQSAQLRL